MTSVEAARKADIVALKDLRLRQQRLAAFAKDIELFMERDDPGDSQAAQRNLELARVYMRLAQDRIRAAEVNRRDR